MQIGVAFYYAPAQPDDCDLYHVTCYRWFDGLARVSSAAEPRLTRFTIVQILATLYIANITQGVIGWFVELNMVRP